MFSCSLFFMLSQGPIHKLSFWVQIVSRDSINLCRCVMPTTYFYSVFLAGSMCSWGPQSNFWILCGVRLTRASRLLRCIICHGFSTSFSASDILLDSFAELAVGCIYIWSSAYQYFVKIISGFPLVSGFPDTGRPGSLETYQSEHIDEPLLVSFYSFHRFTIS